MAWDEIRQLMFVKVPNSGYIVGSTTCSPSIRLFLVSRTAVVRCLVTDLTRPRLDEFHAIPLAGR
jgi:hypothetical protein